MPACPRRSASARAPPARSPRSGPSGRDLDAEPAGRRALAILNGAHGDLLQREAPGLALDMTVRVADRAVPVTTDALRRGVPRPPATGSRCSCTA